MLIIAHRSGPVNFPEQTVAAAEEALSFGAGMVEIDLRLNKEGRLIVCHDDNAMRVFGEDIQVENISTDRFRALRHKDAPDYTAHLFEDYIDAGIRPLLLHIKNGNECVDKAIELLEKKNYLSNVVFGVTKPEYVSHIKNYSSDIPVLAFIKNPDYIDANIEAGADFVRLWEGNVTPERIEYIRSRGKKVWIMAGHVNGYEVGYTSDEFREFLLKGNADGVLINDVRGFVNAPGKAIK